MIRKDTECFEIEIWIRLRRTSGSDCLDKDGPPSGFLESNSFGLDQLHSYFVFRNGENI